MYAVLTSVHTTGLHMRRRSKEEKPAANARKYELKFGWCTDGHHHQCRVQYTDWNKIEQECYCSCHKEK